MTIKERRMRNSYTSINQSSWVQPHCKQKKQRSSPANSSPDWDVLSFLTPFGVVILIILFCQPFCNGNEGQVAQEVQKFNAIVQSDNYTQMRFICSGVAEAEAFGKVIEYKDSRYGWFREMAVKNLDGTITEKIGLQEGKAYQVYEYNGRYFASEIPSSSP